MKKYMILLVAISFLAVGCKNKKTAETLEGTWNEVSVDGVAVPAGAQDQLVFPNCKGGKSNECSLTVIDGSSTFTTNLTYTIEDGGESIVLITQILFGEARTVNTITSLTDNSMTIDWSGSWGYTGEYIKQ